MDAECETVENEETMGDIEGVVPRNLNQLF